jgi:hypothetical protein
MKLTAFKYGLTTLIFIIFFMTLLSVQLCLFAYEKHSQLNLLLILYVYVLFTNCSMSILSILAIMLDSMTYLSTQITGLTIIFLAATSWLALKIKDDMYNKIFIPLMFIFLYAIFYNMLLLYHVHHNWHTHEIIGRVLLTTLQNGISFIILWMLNRQTLHH